MKTYTAFYNQKKTEVTANSSYEAQQKAIAFFKPPKSKKHMVHVQVHSEEPIIATF